MRAAINSRGDKAFERPDLGDDLAVVAIPKPEGVIAMRDWLHERDCAYELNGCFVSGKSFEIIAYLVGRALSFPNTRK